MKIMKGIAGALVGMMAAGAMAADTPATSSTTSSPKPSSSTSVAKKKAKQKKSFARLVLLGRSQAKQDSLHVPQSSAVSSMNATTSMPGFTAGTSTADAPKALQKKTFLSDVRAGVQFEYYGASIAEPFSGWQTDKNTGYSRGTYTQEVDTRVTLGYALSSNLTLTANGYFWSYGDSSDGTTKGESFGFRPADSYLKLGFGKFYQYSKFKWNGDFRAYPGVGTAYPGRVAYLRTGQNFTYSVTPRLTFADYNTIRYYHNNDSAYAPQNDSKGEKVDGIVTIGPAIEYQLFDTAGISLSFNDAFAHTHRNNTISEVEHYWGGFMGAYFELGASVDITKKINLNPYVDMYTHTFNVEALQLGANLNFTIL